MIEKYCFGQPVWTGAVVEDAELSKGRFPFGTIKSEWPFEWNYTLDSQDIVYGLGESMGGINKRGRKLVSWCSDESHQDETKESIYGAHNFLIIFGKETFGLFFDTPSRVEFDIGFTLANQLTVKTSDTGVKLYLITPEKNSSDSIQVNIVSQFRKMIGQSYIPPMWALGFQQSRWGYNCEEDIRNVVKIYKENKIPVSAVCMDIDYMTEYEDFTVDGKKFPNLEKLSSDMKKEGVHLVPIIDAGVKVKEGYSVYEEGCAKDYFCKKADGKNYVAGVWPGRSHFPDFFKKEVRQWFGQKYKSLTDAGIDGFWNDMNEPAMFYSEEGLEKIHQQLKDTDVSNLDINSFFKFAYLGPTLQNSMEDYQRFYNVVTNDDGSTKAYRHDKVHNCYGALMTRAAGEELENLFPDERKLLYSRASYIGAHRYGGIWTGDCCSWWSHLEQQIKMLPGLNMCGFLYSGSDTGGFGDNTSRELLLRWTELSIFTPLFRNHSALGTREQEYYRFENISDFKNLLDLRYALIPYLYSEFVKAAVNNKMLFRPLSFDFEGDRMLLEIEDQLMVCSDLMIAPVYKQNASGRYVYLPEDMTQVIWKNSKAETLSMSKGLHYIQAPQGQVSFFIRKNHAIPLKTISPDDTFSALNLKGENLQILGDGKCSPLYQDDGLTRKIICS